MRPEYHTEAFGVSIEQSREVWDEALRVICGLFLNDTFPGHKGRHYEIPERKLVPKPVQRPHPPLWVAATSQATFASAARAGLGVLGFTAVPPEELAPPSPPIAPLSGRPIPRASTAPHPTSRWPRS